MIKLPKSHWGLGDIATPPPTSAPFGFVLFLYFRTAKDAISWLVLIKEELGDTWLNNKLFRFKLNIIKIRFVCCYIVLPPSPTPAP